MSISKLESLPNEILTDLFEKYINGIDLLRAFAFQLNQRFDLLILRCQRFRFDFMRCRKDDFSFCMGLLPVYIDRIQQLALSEQNTPGQIYAFLHYFSSFTSFEHLQKLYIHIDTEAVQPNLIEQALDSLSKTSLHTLAMKIIKPQLIFSLNDIVVKLFCMTTMKHLSISADNHRMNWEQMNDLSSNIEYLTLDGIICQMDELKNIFQCASALKYLNTQVNLVYYNVHSSKSKKSSENSIKPISMLHTMILKINDNGRGILTQLEPYLKSMSSLQRLEIKMQNELSDITAWETLLKTSAPNLTHFILETQAFDRNDLVLKSLLESIRTPFWIEKKNFNIVIKEFEYFNHWRMSSNSHKLDTPVDRWHIEPQRNHNDHQYATDTITNLKLSTQSSSLLQNYYLNNVNKLVINDLHATLFELITTHVNCARIKYLDVSEINEQSIKICSLLSYIKNIISIQMKFQQLYDMEYHCLRECNKIKFVDLSTRPHKFEERDISMIRNIFPNVEHLTINTRDLRSVPSVQTYLPHLHSLRFVNLERDNLYNDYYDDYNDNDDYAQKRAAIDLRQRAQFLFHRDSVYTTIWLDKAALQEQYWKTATSNY